MIDHRLAVRVASTVLVALVMAACQAPVRGPVPDAAAPMPGQDSPVTEAAGESGSTQDRDSTLTGPADRADNTDSPRPSDIIARLRDGLLAPTCGPEPRIQHWLAHYRRPSQRLAWQLRDIQPVLEHVLTLVEAAGLPTQFALIPLIESGYRPYARGSGGTAGMWQFIPATARGNGLMVNSRYDGRLSAHDASVAALAHLAGLSERFGDWRAAVMAFNAGEYRLTRAMRASGTSLPSTGIQAAGTTATETISAERRLPAGLAPVTYDYVARLRALSCLIADPGGHGLEFDPDPGVLPLATIELPPGRFEIRQIARTLSVDADRMAWLNAGHLGGQVDARSPRTLLLPGNTRVDRQTLARLAQTVIEEHIVGKGDSLWLISRKHGMTVTDLLEWNDLNAGAVLQPGQRIRLAP